MTKVSRAKLAIAYQGGRTLHATAWLLSLRQTENKRLIRRKKAFAWGMRYGIARIFEDLRRVRMSLVPRLESTNRLLQ
jgi:hypothetical protein